MSHNPLHAWNTQAGWSITSGNAGHASFTLWLTGLHGTGKTTIAVLLKKALSIRGYKVEIIDNQTFSRWLQQELHLEEEVREDRSHIPGYEAFITYLCAYLTRNGVISITTSISPYLCARAYAREQIGHFIEIYLYCSIEQRTLRLRQQERPCIIPEALYEPPPMPELSINTSHDIPEHSALRIISYLEQHSHIAPLWSDQQYAEEPTTIKARLQSLDLLE